jgi:hypothetical protein
MENPDRREKKMIDLLGMQRSAGGYECIREMEREKCDLLAM